MNKITIALLLILGGCTLLPKSPFDAPANQPGLAIYVKADSIYEQCFKMQKNMTLQYQFEATKTIDFNIHYHVGERLYYPVETETVDKKQGVMTASIDQIYCLMWVNNALEPVGLQFSYTTSN